MTTTALKFSMLCVAALLLSACSGPTSRQAAPPPPAVEQAAATTAKPEVSINAVMVALVDHAGHNLWDVEKEGKAPKTDADWQNVWEHAELSRSLLKLGGGSVDDYATFTASFTTRPSC